MTPINFEREEQIAAALAEAVKTYTPPPGLQKAIRERLFARLPDLASPQLCTAGARPTESPIASATLPRRWTRSRLARYDVLATVVSLLVVLTIILGKHGNLGTKIAFADVQEAVRQMKSAVITMIHPLQPDLNTKVFLLGTNQSRKEQDGLVFIHDRTKEQMLVLRPGDKTAWFTPALQLDDPWSSLDPVLKIEEKAVEKLGERQFDGKTLIGFRLGRTDPKSPAGADAERCEAWIDPQTRLPSRLQSEPTNPHDPIKSHQRLVIEFDFNMSLEESLFNMTPPKDYRLVEYSPLGPTPTPPENMALASPVIMPGLGIGLAKFGMSIEQVIERLGPPSDVWYVYQKPRGEYRSRMKEGDDHIGFAVEYKAHGFTLFVDRKEGLTVVRSHDGLPVFAGFKAFPGRTSEGISLGSPREQVEKAYGTPEKIRILDKNLLGLSYNTVNLWFLVTDGKVTSIEAKKPAREGDNAPTTPAPAR